GADGARSTVARRFGLGVNRRFLVGTEVELTGVSGLDPECLHCLLDSRLAPGYLAWAFTGVATTQVGLACVAHWRPDLRAWLERLGGLCDMSRARVVARRGGLIPVGGVVAPCHAPQVMLIGDAAGVVSPLSAGGIHTALSTGRLAAHLLADHLLDGGLEPGTLLARRLPRFRLKRIARRLLELRPPGIALDALLESRAFRAAAARIFFHRRAHPRRRASGESVLDPRC
ncbi:MAG: NAD(P)/FAD-dependent oxidoreductase, partial [Planctomycetota bacterium]|nr:NAD(P)/FAD-dependent oxidoreductase [Planctomycetota bacterium]